jgi:magnesium-transporting ATPase (P-type)
MAKGTMARAGSVDREEAERGPGWKLWVAPGLAALATLVSGALFYGYHRSVRAKLRGRGLLPEAAASGSAAPDLTPGKAQDRPQFQGLSGAEVEARRTTHYVRARRSARRRARLRLLRKNALNIFNLDLTALMVIQWWLDDPLGALLTLFVLFFNTVVNLFFEWVALLRIERLSMQTRPTVLAIREGGMTNLELEDVVIGDVLVVGPGDEFAAQGKVLAAEELVVDQATLGAARHSTQAGEGEVVPAGSYCLRGWAAYEVQALSKVAHDAVEIDQVHAPAEHRTSLQQIIQRILYALAVIVIVLLIWLLADMLGWGGLLTDKMLGTYRSHIGRVFSLAPGSLFLMIAVSYAFGSSELGRIGALVRDARVVEALAETRSMFFGRFSAWARAAAEIEMLPLPEGMPNLSRERARQLLGAYLQSSRAQDPILRSIQRTVSGEPRLVDQEVPYLSALGWSAITFAERDVEGTFVLGIPEVLQAHLYQPSEKEERLAGGSRGAVGLWDRLRTRVGRLVEHSETSPEALRPERVEPATDGASLAAQAPAAPLALGTEAGVDSMSGNRGPGLRLRQSWRWLRSRAGSLVQHRVSPSAPEPDGRYHLLFAYSPQAQPLYSAGAHPELPSALVPICRLHFDDHVQPEALQTLRAVAREGVRVKLLAPEVPELALTAVDQISIGEREDAFPVAVSGLDLAAMDVAWRAEAAHKSAVFGPISVEQGAELVRLLREDEEVAMVGDAIDDVPAMRQASVGLAFKSSARAVLGAASVVLLDETPHALPRLLRRVRQIVNNVLASLKLNLAQILHVLLLELLILASVRSDFYYRPTHGGVIAAFAVILPGLALSFWPPATAVPRKSLVPQLVRFVVPAGLLRVVMVLVLDALLARTGLDVLHRQNAVTLALIVTGLILCVYVQPPRLDVSGATLLRRDWRSVVLVLVLLALYLVFVSLDLVQLLLHLRHLPRAQDYAIVVLVVIVWDGLLHMLWRIPRLNPYDVSIP